MKYSPLIHLAHLLLLLLCATSVSANPFELDDIDTYKAPSISEFDPHVMHGMSNIFEKIIDEVTISGPSEILNSQITKKALLIGPANIESSRIAYLELHGPLTATLLTSKYVYIHGPSYLNKTSISDKLLQIGALTANGCDFNQLTVMASNSILKNSTAYDITIKQDLKFPYQPQSLTLSGDTHIHGTITFEQGDGILYISDPQVIFARVNGGSVVYLYDPSF